jgi:hypothetical protein
LQRKRLSSFLSIYDSWNDRCEGRFASGRSMNLLSLWDSLNSVQQGEAMASATVVVFALTYVGMALGRIPGLRVDRSGIAMLAAVVLVAMGAIPADQIVRAMHFPTLLLMRG